VTESSDHFFVKRIRQIGQEPTAALVRVAELEAVALIEQNEVLRKENEKLKTYADINWLKRELDALTERVGRLEKPDEDR
jgi:ubiquinone biosynthesis protein UbiJ